MLMQRVEVSSVDVNARGTQAVALAAAHVRQRGLRSRR